MNYQTVARWYLPRLLSLLVGQEAILSLSFFFLQELSDLSERPTSSFRISLTSCMRHLVKSWKEILPFSSAPSWFMISATDSSIFNWRHTISKSFLHKGFEQKKHLGVEPFELEKMVHKKKKSVSWIYHTFLIAFVKVLSVQKDLFHLGYSRQELYYYLEKWGNFKPFVLSCLLYPCPSPLFFLLKLVEQL